MNFKRYYCKALEKVCNEIKEHMKATNREDLKNEYYIWHDMWQAIERELDRRALNGEAVENNRHLNEDLRRMIEDKGVKHYEIADYLGVSESAFSKILRKPIDEKRRQDILNAIEDIRV